MKKINFYDLPELLKDSGNEIFVEFDSDKTDLRLHLESYFKWAHPKERNYKAIENKIRRFGKRGKGFHVYMWCDISGFDYWMNKQHENNYIQITIAFTKPTINKTEIESLKEAILKAVIYAKEICDKCDEHLIY